MKNFREMSGSELDKIEVVYKMTLKNLNNMIDLLELEPDAFKKVFIQIFGDNIHNRKVFKKKMEG